MFYFILPPKRWLRFNSGIVKTHFASLVTLNNSEIIAETRSYIFRCCSCCRRRPVCVNSLSTDSGRFFREVNPTSGSQVWFYKEVESPEVKTTPDGYHSRCLVVIDR